MLLSLAGVLSPYTNPGATAQKVKSAVKVRTVHLSVSRAVEYVRVTDCEQCGRGLAGGSGGRALAARGRRRPTGAAAVRRRATRGDRRGTRGDRCVSV